MVGWARLLGYVTAVRQAAGLSGANAIAFMPYVDAILRVVGEAGATRKQLTAAYGLLGGDKVVDIVLNQSTDSSTGRGYDY